MNNNEINDLKIIRIKYGEAMSHFCRQEFSTILQEPGVLSNLMLKYFEPSKYLYDDLINHHIIGDFKNFIFSKFSPLEEDKSNEILLTPEELLKKKGYILKECTTEEEIQSYKKYYSKNEELCTFKGGRLDKCRVFFAVKENVDEIRREYFSNPRRQDEYGTSVISIQFSRDKNHVLSIKNRYNHTVDNPDATFSNNLDNIISGLTDSFEKYKDLKQRIIPEKFEIPGYVRSAEGKYYKYNYELDGIYYCPNNYFINRWQVKRLEPEKYILMDWYILDLVNKRLITRYPKDSFSKELKDIKKIEIFNNKETKEKEVKVICNFDKLVVIKLDKYNRIVGYSNNKMEKIENFLEYNHVLKKLSIPSVKVIGKWALSRKKLENIIIPEGVTTIGDYAFCENKLTNVVIPKGVTTIGSCAFSNNQLTNAVIPEGVTTIDEGAFYKNQLTNVVIPKGVTTIGSCAFAENQLTNAVIPEGVTAIGKGAFYKNQLTNVVIPKGVTSIGDYAFSNNQLTNVVIPEGVTAIGKGAFYKNQLTNVVIPKGVTTIGSCVFAENQLTNVVIPEGVTTIGDYAFGENQLTNTKIKKKIL